MEMKQVYENANERMHKTIRALNGEYDSIRAGRANASVLDKIQVDYYGVPTPINQMAAISVAEARILWALDRKLGRTALSVSSTHARRRHRHWHEWRKRWTLMPGGGTASKHLLTMTRPSCYNDVRMIYSTL